jgi:hypothetical protein
MSNEILPFCATDSGSNLLTQAEYTASSDRTSGNKPGVASAKLNNKALRQSSFIAAQLAQLVANTTGADVLDDNSNARILAQLTAALSNIAPNLTKYLSGSGNFNLCYVFYIASGSATSGATYTNNGVTFTVAETVASGLVVRMTGNSDPTVSGTLTKTGGTGDTTLTFYARRKPLSLRVRLVAGGGGGSGSSTTAANDGGDGSDGNDTTFGTTLLAAVKGLKGTRSAGGGGGSASLGTGPLGLALIGATGGGASQVNVASSAPAGGDGGSTPFGGGGAGGSLVVNGIAASANTGSGGGGAGAPATGHSGSGGGAGGYVDALINSPLSTYAYVVGAGGGGGAAGTSGLIGGAGAAGLVEVVEMYQ